MCEWISATLQNNNIPNFSIQECFTLFGSCVVPLQEYMLITVGRLENQEEIKEEEKEENNFQNKHVSFLKILSNIEGHKPLQGIHCIQLFESPTASSQFWVYSLSSLRHKLLHFTDYLSFERSTFLILPQHRKLIRLKCIRSIVTLPTTQPQQMYQNAILCGPDVSSFIHSTKECEVQIQKLKTITSRTQSQFKKHLEQIYTSYVRDLHTQHNKKDILLQLQQDIQKYLNELEKIL